MGRQDKGFRIVFQKLAETDERELGEIADILAEAEEIERLRRIVLEVERPEPQTSTTT